MNEPTPKTPVISIGYGRHLFTPGNPERARMAEVAGVANELHMIVFTLARDGCTEERVSSSLTLHPTNSVSKFTMLFDAYRLGARLIKAAAVPVVVTTQDPFEAGMVGYWLKQRFPVHLTVQEHGDVFSTPHWRAETMGNRVRFYIGLHILRAADTIRVVSARIRRTMRRLVPRAHITLLPVALDLAPLRAAAKAPKPAPADTFWFLWVGRYVPQKNLPLLVRAFAAVHRELPHARLRLVGRGPLRAEVEALARAQFAGAAAFPVEFIDWSDRVPELMREADAYVLSSNYEGWARVLIEAMVCGLPVVTTDVGCVGEVLHHEEHGLVVPVGDESALTAAMRQLMIDQSLRHKLETNLATLNEETLPGVGLTAYGPAWVDALR